MVWQDFMFGNEMQPGTYPFKLSVAQEAADQIRRLRNHPSIVLWSGNNETEAAVRLAGRVNVDPATFLQMWEGLPHDLQRNPRPGGEGIGSRDPVLAEFAQR